MLELTQLALSAGPCIVHYQKYLDTEARVVRAY